MKDIYNYSLNGVYHEIELNNKIKIIDKPKNEINLYSQKLLLKYIHDLFEIYKIDYFISNHTLLGYKIFNGIHIFKNYIELTILDTYIDKIDKIKQKIIDDEFTILITDNYIKVSTIFMNECTVSMFIYILKQDINQDKLITNIKNKNYYHNFYDIYPLHKKEYEDIHVYVPNKIEKVLNNYDIKMENIIFTNTNDDDTLF
jgi:hypothetical protein